MNSEFIELENQITISYVWVEPEVKESDIVLIFLHEALGSIGQWKRFPQLLCNQLGCRGLIYERQGYGNSSALTQKRNNTYLEDYALIEMPFVIKKLLPAEKLILIGHSDGGSIALLYASKFSQNICGIVTMAAHVFVEKETVNGIYPAIEAYKAGKLAGLQKYHGEKTDELFRAWSETWLSEDYQTWNITSQIKQNVPSFILQGKQDEYGTEEQLKAIKHQLPQAETMLLEGIFHQPHLEQTKAISELIFSWIQKNIFEKS
jgi:pimeloyl-ACP methyl ester carboxylesterase